MGTIAAQITSLAIVYLTVYQIITSLTTVYSTADQRKYQSSTSLVFVRGIHWWPVNSPQKWPVTRKMFPLVISLVKNITWPIDAIFVVLYVWFWCGTGQHKLSYWLTSPKNAKHVSLFEHCFNSCIKWSLTRNICRYRHIKIHQMIPCINEQWSNPAASWKIDLRNDVSRVQGDE